MSERTVFSLLDDLAAHPGLVVGLPLAAGIAASVMVLVMPPTYASSASFVPENASQPRLPAGLSGIASQFGVSLGGELSRSPSFYADLLRSREILAATLTSKVPNPLGTADSITVYDLYKVKGRTPALRLEEGLKVLSHKVTVAVDPRTDVVHLSVEARFPEAARDVAERLFQQLSAFNLDTRQSTARNRRTFIEGRVAATEQDLAAAEDALRAFYERNRQWETAPELRFEQQRLTRQVTVQQELYMTLRREYEAARVEEVNTTPVFTVIDQPQVPGRRLRPRRKVTVLTVAIVVGVLACVTALAVERHRELLASGDPDYRRLLGRLPRLGRAPRADGHAAAR